MSPVKQADAFMRWCDDNGIVYREHGDDSKYVTVTVPDAECARDPNGETYDDELVVRFSDHGQPAWGGFSERLGYRHGEADFTIDPTSSTTVKEVKALILQRVALCSKTNPPRPRIIDEMVWFDMTAEERDAVIAESVANIMEAAAGANVIQLNSTESPQTVIIHPSTHKGEAGLWQISWLDEAGVPSMHETADSREDALRYMAGDAVGQLRGQIPHMWFVSGTR